MDMKLYDYELIAEHPSLLAFYSGWLGQKTCALMHYAVTWDRAGDWREASAEVDRLTLVLNAAEKAKLVKLATEPGSALGTLVGHCADGGWWTSDEGTRERSANHDDEIDVEQADDGHAGGSDSPLFPRLMLQEGASYAGAGAVLGVLDETLRGVAAELANLDLCRLGVQLSGFCYRLTPTLHVRFVNSVLDDLAGRDMIDLQAENELRRALRLVEVDADRRPVTLSDPKVYPASVFADAHREGQGDGGRAPFDPNIDVTVEHRDLILACVFSRFSLPIPPAESDAASHQDLADLRGKLRAPGGKATMSRGKTGSAEQTEFWTDEAIVYLGLDRLGLKRPEMFLQRLIKTGSLRPTKIGRRNVFKKADLDRVREKGDRARRRGRSRRDEQ